MKKSMMLCICGIAVCTSAGWLLFDSWGIWLLVAAALLAVAVLVQLVRDMRRK